MNALLGDTPTLVNYGSALMANLGDKEVKAVVCITQYYSLPRSVDLCSISFVAMLASFSVFFGR